MRDGSIAVACERLHYGHFGYDVYIVADAIENYQILKEDIYWEHSAAVRSRTWPHSQQFDEFILRLAQSGIQRHWESIVSQNTNIIKNILKFFLFLVHHGNSRS